MVDRPAIKVQGLTKVYRHDNPFKRHRNPPFGPSTWRCRPTGRSASWVSTARGRPPRQDPPWLLAPPPASPELGGDIRSRDIRSRVGYLPELPYFPMTMTARELLRHFRYLYGLRGKALSSRWTPSWRPSA
jgi:hypothetical protein